VRTEYSDHELEYTSDIKTEVKGLTDLAISILEKRGQEINTSDSVVLELSRIVMASIQQNETYSKYQ